MRSRANQSVSYYYGWTLLWFFLWLLGGCSAAKYKEQADNEVYKVIDAKWRAEFGPQSNFRINDTPAGPNDIQVSAILKNRRVLRLCDAVQTAVVQNRDYQAQKESLYLQVLSLTQARHDFAPQLFSSFAGGYTNDGNEETVDAGGGLGLRQTLADGGQLSVDVATNWLRYLGRDPRTSLASVLSASFRQPLLRGAGRKVAQENLTQAERDSLYEMRRFARYRKEFVVEIVSTYYRVLQAQDDVTNTENNFLSLQDTQERLAMMAQAGRLARFEVQQAQQQTLQARDSYIQAQESYALALDQYKLFLGLPPTSSLELDPNELTALKELEITDPNFDVDEAVKTALATRLDLLTSIDQVEDARRKIVVAEDALQAELNLVGNMEVDSGDGTEFHKFNFERSRYGAGVELDLPFERTAERNNYRRALINLMRQERACSQAFDQVKLDIRQACRDLRKAATRYKIQQVSLQLAQRREESTKLLVDAGRATTRDWLDAQADLFSSQTGCTDALVTYYIAKLNYARDMELLQVKPDGSWYEQPPASRP